VARVSLAGARRAWHVDEADRHVDRQNGKTLAGLREGLHDSYIQGTVGIAPADHPAGATAVGTPDYHAAILAVRLASSVARKSSVFRNGWLGSIRIARSLVILPPSTVSTQTFSSASANFTTSGVLSNVPRYLSPWVQAKIEAIGLVEVGLPFWCSR